MVDKIGRCERRNITKFPRNYLFKLELYQILEIKMIFAFELVFVSKIKERIKELHKVSISQSKFVEYFKDEFFEDDLKRMIKRSFLEQIEQRFGCEMDPRKLIKDFEKKFS